MLTFRKGFIDEREVARKRIHRFVEQSVDGKRVRVFIGVVAVHEDILTDCIPRTDDDHSTLPGDPEPRDVLGAHVHERIVFRDDCILVPCT